MRSSLKTSLIRGTTLFGFAAASAAAVGVIQVGCSSASSSEPGAPQATGSTAPSVGDTGSLGLKLTLPGGEQLNSVTYTVTGPNGGSSVIQTGMVSVQGSLSVSFTVSGIPAGSNYSITISGTTTDGNTTCVGSATFSIVSRTTTTVNDLLQCSSPVSEAGSAAINGQTYDCATWSTAAVQPSTANLGTPVAVSATANAVNPGAVTYTWTASSGTFDHPNQANANFTCTQDGPATLTLTVADGPVPDGGSCNPATSTTTLTVNCTGHVDQAAQFATATKIKHVIVVFGENISYDHYFATYPNAQNNPGETAFSGAAPANNNLAAPLDPTHGFSPVTGVNLLSNNPNFTNAGNDAGAANPFRLAPNQAGTSDQGHNYKPEQLADDNGAMDLFPAFTGTKGPPPGTDAGAPAAALTTGLVMGYYDGNTVSTIWNLAQSYALNDNSWSTVFGPSTPGALNLISGQTNGIGATSKALTSFSVNHVVQDGAGGWTMIGDTDPLGDTCSTSSEQTQMTGKNIGDLLNAKGISWGFFEGGFDLTQTNSVTNTTGCALRTPNAVPVAGPSADYIPHHQPFQYYASTANPTHARPSSLAAVGKSLETDGVTPEPANHQYDSHDFFDALSAGNMPAVAYLKAPAFQDGHPGYSDPIDEGNFIGQVVTAVQASQEWASTVIVLAYDDSDGWYDHQLPPIVNPSQSAADALNGAGLCSSGAQQNGAAPTTPLLGVPPADGGAAVPVQGRCGYGTRMPLLVVSPYSKRNFIDHTLTDQTSILRFIEDNWLSGQRVQPGGSFDTVAGTIQNMLQGI